MSWNENGYDENGNYNRQADDVYWENRRIERDKVRLKMTPIQLKNNPKAQPMCDFTGRCRKCGSNDLWDDISMYGCNSCNAMFANQ